MCASPKIAIIVPVYNVERYLRRCLDSLVRQSLRDIEIVCVDDGSSDDSRAILLEYALRDVRVKVIAQENAGVAAARNAGLARSSAPYVMFCDPDDWAEETWCEELLAAIESSGADFAVSRAAIDGDCPARQRIVLERNQTLRYQGLQNVRPDMCFKVDHGLWIHIFRRRQLESYGIVFPVGTCACEDWLFCKMVMATSRKAYFLDRILYHYVQRGGSALNGSTTRSAIALEFLKNVLPFYRFLRRQKKLNDGWGEVFVHILADGVGNAAVSRSVRRVLYEKADQLMTEMDVPQLEGFSQECAEIIDVLRRHKVHLLNTTRWPSERFTVVKRKGSLSCLSVYLFGIRIYRKHNPWATKSGSR